MNHHTLDGVKMLHHDEMRNYDRIQGKIISVILNHGCKTIETPNFEDYDVYQHFFPHMRQQMVKTIDTDGRVLVLRPDVTLPVVETAAREFPRPNQLLKFGYVSTVFREYFGRSTYGKDFLQGGIEILGDSSPECDGEVIVMAAEILKAVGVETIHIDIGTAAYTKALFDGLPLDEEQKDTLRSYLADRNLVACRQYIASLPLSGDARKALEALPVLFGPYAQTLSKAKELCINSGMLNALSRLERIYDYVLYAGFADKVQLDFGFASKLGYYTDMVFKVYVERGAADVGIVGEDVLIEEAPGADVYEVMDLGIGRCRMAVAGIAGKPVDMTKRITIGTKYPRIARQYFEQHHHSVDIIKLNGSVELAPLVGLSDVIVDIVETGNTLKANGLEVLQYFMDFSARMICNPVSFKMKYKEIQELMQVIQQKEMEA